MFVLAVLVWNRVSPSTILVWNRVCFPFVHTSLERPSEEFHCHLRNSVSAGGWRLEFFLPFPLFAGERCSRAVAVFLFTLILLLKTASVENSPLKSVLISSNKTATNCCYCHSHWKLLSLLDFWFTQAIRTQTRLHGWKAFPSDPECFRNFQPEVFLNGKRPQLHFRQVYIRY